MDSRPWLPDQHGLAEQTGDVGVDMLVQAYERAYRDGDHGTADAIWLELRRLRHGPLS